MKVESKKQKVTRENIRAEIHAMSKEQRQVMYRILKAVTTKEDNRGACK